MKIQLSDHFSYRKLLKFTLPSIAMMIFTSIYSVVDGFFISNFAGKIPFAAINLIMPVLMILGTVGFMFGTGGTALVALTYGEGDRKKANEYFSLLVYSAAALGIMNVAGVDLGTSQEKVVNAQEEKKLNKLKKLIDENYLYTLKGETKQGDVFEEFYVDETDLFELILKIFYEPVEQ